MGRPILLLRLEGPLQAWGLRSHWDVRDTGEEPSKSGIVGMLGAALGWGRRDSRLDELEQSLIIGVRIEREGQRMIDFQTVSGQLPTAEGGTKGSEEDPSTITSPRSYLQDAAFLVALAGPEPVLKACAEALQFPRWPVYLGRKSCPPTRPVFEGLTDQYASLEEALRDHPWEWGGMLEADQHPARLRVIIEDTDGEAIRPDRLRTNPGRIYESRAVRVATVDFPGVAPTEPSAGGGGV